MVPPPSNRKDRMSLLPKPRQPPRSALKKLPIPHPNIQPAPTTPSSLANPPPSIMPAGLPSKSTSRSRLPHPTVARRIPPPTFSSQSNKVSSSRLAGTQGSTATARPSIDGPGPRMAPRTPSSPSALSIRSTDGGYAVAAAMLHSAVAARVSHTTIEPARDEASTGAQMEPLDSGIVLEDGAVQQGETKIHQRDVGALGTRREDSVETPIVRGRTPSSSSITSTKSKSSGHALALHMREPVSTPARAGFKGPEAAYPTPPASISAKTRPVPRDEVKPEGKGGDRQVENGTLVDTKGLRKDTTGTRHVLTHPLSREVPPNSPPMSLPAVPGSPNSEDAKVLATTLESAQIAAAYRVGAQRKPADRYDASPKATSEESPVMASNVSVLPTVPTNLTEFVEDAVSASSRTPTEAVVTHGDGQEESYPHPVATEQAKARVAHRPTKRVIRQSPSTGSPASIRPLFIRKPFVPGGLKVKAHLTASIVPAGVQSLLGEIDRFTAEWSDMFDGLLARETVATREGGKVTDGEVLQANAAVDIGPIGGSPRAREQASRGAPSTPRLRLPQLGRVPVPTEEVSVNQQENATAAKEDENELDGLYTWIPDSRPERWTHRDVAVVKDAPALVQIQHADAPTAPSLEAIESDSLVMGRKKPELGSEHLGGASVTPQIPPRDSYRSYLPEINMSPIISESPLAMNAIISALSMETNIATASTSLAVPAAPISTPPKSVNGITTPYLSSPLAHVTLQNATVPPSSSQRAPTATPHVSSPLAQASFTAELAPAEEDYAIMRMAPLTSVSYNSMPYAQGVPRASEPSPEPVRPRQRPPPPMLSPRPVSDTTLVSPRLSGSMQQTAKFSAVPPASAAAPLMRSSSLRTGLGIKSLFRRTERFSTSTSNPLSIAMSPMGPEEVARRKRAESLKSMIGEPIPIGLGVEGIGLGVSIASVGDLTMSGRRESRKAGRGSFGLSVFGRANDSIEEETEEDEGENMPPGFKKLSRVGSSRNLLRKKTK
ncbi:hypothetical protein BV25DRAFT_1916941 [Artomyces pyxidatus]|uniref:Uncharacterized protein n=1 Tax=Artomyces pyxidatus TaxID=48021 RepID=A0ACB8SZH0_9AGAM|nr:hypothetical protein BV25DRAFT_1916941 [Artomyces pyxidatus]